MRDSMPERIADPNHGKYQRSKRHELRLARELNGRRLPNSGGARRSRWDSQRSQSGDIETKRFLVEHKYTVKNSIAVKREWMTKVEAGARTRRKTPALILTFDGNAQLDLAVVRVRDLEQLTGLKFRPEESEPR